MEEDIEYFTKKVAAALGVNPLRLGAAQRDFSDRVREACADNGVDFRRVRVATETVETLLQTRDQLHRARAQSSGSGDFSIGSQVWPGAAKLIEEMAELQQLLAKLIATAGKTKYWGGVDLKERVKEEMADVEAAMMFFARQNFSAEDEECIKKRAELKGDLYEKWHAGQDPLP